MKTLRRWLLNSERRLSLPLAADARLSPTDYFDDQVWELRFGGSDSAALALQTHYGGRVGLASLIPMWLHDGRVIYQTSAYARAPEITAFAPGYLRVQATLTSQLALQAEYWAMESHAVGGRFTISNAHVDPTEVRFDLFGHLAAQGKERPVRVLPLSDQTHALHFEKAGNLNPIVIVEGGSAQIYEDVPVISPKIGRTFTIGGRKKVELRWVHAALPDTKASLALAQRWMSQNWENHFKRIAQGALMIPDFETEDDDLDLAIAASLQKTVLSFLKPTSHLPHASFVAERSANTGFSPRGDGTDYMRTWNGQTPTLAYLTALGAASIDPTLAQGIVRNYLAVQKADGWIDWKPGLAGQQQGMLCLPILARLAWGVFQYSEDVNFLKEVFPALLKFFQRWLQPDLDADQDGIPEWQIENQTGYAYWPTFALSQSWAHNADMHLVEAPDLLAYLLSEAMSLRAIAQYLHQNDAEKALEAQLQKLKVALEALWHDGRYIYRDRDTHQTSASFSLLNDGRADEEHLLAHQFGTPNRLIVRIEGGVDHAPSFTMTLTGLDKDGQQVEEQVSTKAFFWHRNRGVYTTSRVYSQVDRLRFAGLSRVYRVDVYTPDTSRLDINALLPLWSVSLGAARAEALIELLTDPQHFWRSSGVTMCSAQDALFDPSNANGGGGVWPFWLTLMGEGLIEAGRLDLAVELVQRVMTIQTHVLKTQGAFSEYYDSDKPLGLGEADHLSGVIPIHLLLRAVGVRIVSGGKVWTGGPFLWKQPITIRQHGVVIRRSAEGTSVGFPSGHQVSLPPSAEWQEIIDPNPSLLPPLKAAETKTPSKRSRSKRAPS